jgi:hypothetical protein
MMYWASKHYAYDEGPWINDSILGNDHRMKLREDHQTNLNYRRAPKAAELATNIAYKPVPGGTALRLPKCLTRPTARWGAGDSTNPWGLRGEEPSGQSPWHPTLDANSTARGGCTELGMPVDAWIAHWQAARFTARHSLWPMTRTWAFATNKVANEQWMIVLESNSDGTVSINKRLFSSRRLAVVSIPDRHSVFCLFWRRPQRPPRDLMASPDFRVQTSLSASPKHPGTG